MAAQRVEGLEPALYHVDPLRSMLERVRTLGCDELADLTPYDELLVPSAAVAMISAVFWPAGGSKRLLTVARLAWWSATVGLAAAVAPRVHPLLVHRPVTALSVGICAGAILFATLARKGISPAAVAAIPRDRLVTRALVLTVKSAQEEAVWRALLLGALVGPLGRVGALAASTVLFAAGHVGRQGARAAQQLATGAVFGLVYLATGRLGAAIGAHATYNVLIGVGLLSLADTSGRATSDVLPGFVRSPGPPPIRPRRGARPAVPEQLASLEAVSKSFGAVRALDGIDLELRPGEILALLGPNGAGKSTAVSLMLGLRRADAGQVLLHGLDPRDPEARRHVAGRDACSAAA